MLDFIDIETKILVILFEIEKSYFRLKITKCQIEHKGFKYLYLFILELLKSDCDQISRIQKVRSEEKFRSLKANQIQKSLNDAIYVS